MSFFRCLILSVVVCSLTIPAQPARAAELDPALQDLARAAEANQEVSVIIRYTGRVEPRLLGGDGRREKRKRLVRTLRRLNDEQRAGSFRLLQSLGARPIRPLWIINGLAARVPSSLIERLARRPEIASIRLDRVLEAPGVVSGVAATPLWNLDAIHVPEVWAYGFTGQGVVVANMDTGVDVEHPDLVNQWRGGTNSWYDPNGEHATPYDKSGHGTGVMGVMVGRDTSGNAIGVAPDAQWIAVKIFNDAGSATLSRIHSGYQWLLDPDGDPDTDDAPDIVNNSWGFTVPPACSLEFEPDIGMLKSAGIAVTFSAGNSGPGAYTTISPANNPAAYAVGAVDASLAVAGYSSRGPSTCDGRINPDLVAPGTSIYTTDRSLGGLPLYATMTGTSFAGPHIAGSMALLLSAFPNLTVAQIESALRNTAGDIGLPGPEDESGYGLVNVLAAFEYFDQQAMDTEGDGVPDYRDNCTQIANADQRDTNGDGFGNMCDGDLNNDGATDALDYNRLKLMIMQGSAHPSYTLDADFNGNGVVNGQDLNYFKLKLLGNPPGSSCCG